MIFIGWLIGAAFGFTLGLAALVALSVQIPVAVLAPLALSVTGVPLIVVLVLVVLLYLAAYVIASMTLVLPAVTFPLATPLIPPVSVMVPTSLGELFGRGLSLGLTAALNFVFFLVLTLPSIPGIILSVFALGIPSLLMFTAYNRAAWYLGIVGWLAWLLPMSYFATGVGLLLSMVNASFAFAAGGIGAFRIDWTTGAIETSGGLLGIPALTGGFTGGFSLGNFNFLTSPTIQDDFLGRGLSSHLTGNTLNTAAFGGIVLWINAVDRGLLPVRQNLAYGELTAESHAQGLPPIVGGPPRTDFFVRIWG